MAKKSKGIKQFWEGFNIFKILRGYKKIVLTTEEAQRIYLRTKCVETDEMAHVIANRTGIPFGIVWEILNYAEYDVMGQIGLIKDYT